MMAIHLGEPPTEFTWRNQDKDEKISPLKSYSPLSFYKEVVNINLHDYVMLMNDPTRAYNQIYAIDRNRNLQEGMNWTYANLSTEELKGFAKASLIAGEPMYFSCDVGQYLD